MDTGEWSDPHKDGSPVKANETDLILQSSRPLHCTTINLPTHASIARIPPSRGKKRERGNVWEEGRKAAAEQVQVSLFFCLELACLLSELIRHVQQNETKRRGFFFFFFFFFFFLQCARLSGILLIKSSLAGGVNLRLKVYVTALQKEESVHAAGAREQHSRG